MIYLAQTEKEQHSIHTFLAEKKNWKGYLVLVIANIEDQMLIGKQIDRSKLQSYVNWLIASPQEFKDLLKRYKSRQKTFLDIFVMELTMTGSKGDIFFGAHNWEMLTIDHEPKTDPFDEIFAKVMNGMVDQALYNYNEEIGPIQRRLDQLFMDLFTSGMFHMQPDPKKAMGL